MRIIFMGTDRFAVPALRAVIDSQAELLCVITQPDRPKGRNLLVAPSPVKEVALEHDLPLYQPKRVRSPEFVEEVLNRLKPDVIVVVAFGQILPKEILELPPLGCINTHPSLLPKYRGAAPIQRAVMNGETETGLTVMFMDEGEDTGDVILQQRISIGISDTAELLWQELSDLSAGMISEVLAMAQSGELPRHPQNDSEASCAPKLQKEDGLIDWSRSAFDIHNLIRGTVPWPGAYTAFRDGTQLKIWESRLLGSSRKEPPGTVAEVLRDEGFVIAAGDERLLITTVQPANKARMSARDFVNGYRIKVGDMLS